METQLKVGQRIRIFKILKDEYGGDLKQDKFYAEHALYNPYLGHEYGTQMVIDAANVNIPHNGWHMNVHKMKLVGIMVIKSLK